VGEEPATTTRLGDWYANRLNIGKHRLVLCTSEHSLLSVVVPAKNLPELPFRTTEAVALLLRDIGIPPALIERERREMRWVRFARTASPRVLGHMNDFAWGVENMFRRETDIVYLPEVAVQLADTPCGSMDYAQPREIAFKLLTGAS
jgi:hypothetical protein